MSLAGIQGLSRDDFDLAFTKRGRAIHVIPYDTEKSSLCGLSGFGWPNLVYRKLDDRERVHPLCKRCVDRNILYDLRTTEERNS